MDALKAVLHPILEHPVVFDLQERLCNNYDGVAREFADYLGGRRDVLEVGCSTGACAAAVFDFDRHRYVGIDVQRRYVQLAERRYPRATFLHMDGRRLAFPDGSFDLALFSGTLHHMSDEIAVDVLSQVRRVLRDDGHVLIGEPVFTPDSPVSTFFLRLDRGGHIREAQGYEKLFAGFSIVRQRHFRFAVHRFVSYVLGKSPTL